MFFTAVTGTNMAHRAFKEPYQLKSAQNEYVKYCLCMLDICSLISDRYFIKL